LWWTHGSPLAGVATGIRLIGLAITNFSRSPDTLQKVVAIPRTKSAVIVGIFLTLVILPIGFTIGSVYLTGSRLFLTVAIIPLGVNLVRGRYGPLIATDGLFGLHFVWIILALSMNNPDKVVQNAGSTGVDFLGAYLLGRAYIRDSESFIALSWSLMGILMVCLPFALFEAFTGTSLFIQIASKIPVISAPIDLSIDRRLGLERVQLGFEHPIHWGLFCSLCISLCFVGLGAQLTLLVRLLLAFLICLSGLLALSSGAILAIAVQLGLIIWALVLNTEPKRWLILLACLCLCYVTVDLFSNRTPLRVFMSYATFSAHSAYWRSTIFEWGMVNVWANPIWGLGLNDWVRPVWMHTPSVDNFWLLIAMRYGLPSFIFLAAGYGYAMARIGARSLSDADPLWFFRRAWMFCFVSLTFALTTVHIWGSLYALVFFIFGSGMWLLPQKASPDRTPNPRYVNAYSTASYRSQMANTYARLLRPNFTSKGTASKTPSRHLAE
jgi:hypothetical protein